MENWKKIWNEKLVSQNINILEALIRANGFDTGFGNYTVDQWINWTGTISKILGIKKNDNVFEVGCGSGAFLYGLQKHTGARVFGIDYSYSLIDSASKYVDGTFKVSEAIKNPFNGLLFDIVISHSVFHYFPSLYYAKNVIDMMVKSLKPGGRIALLDINDASCEKFYHEERKKNYTNADEYDQRYKNHSHLFFRKKWVEDCLINLGIQEIQYIPNADDNYKNSRYRFNLFGIKNTLDNNFSKLNISN